MVKAVLLDAYGTLFDTGTGSVQAAQEILARNGREDLSPAEFYGQWKALHHRLMEELPSFRTEAWPCSTGKTVFPGIRRRM